MRLQLTEVKQFCFDFLLLVKMAAPTPEKGGSGSRAKYGNFNNYYQFNKPEERLRMLPKDLVAYCNLSDQPQVVALDIGCNSGVRCPQVDYP